MILTKFKLLKQDPEELFFPEDYCHFFSIQTIAIEMRYKFNYLLLDIFSN